ncbi:MAG: hypothetical protein ABWX93_04265 [Pseudoxanthomonas sp.]
MRHMENKERPPSARERRKAQQQEDDAKLKAGLTAPQLATLHTMEQFRWTLRFVRRPMFMAPVAVLFNRDDSRYAVLEADGSINESPDFKIRP